LQLARFAELHARDDVRERGVRIAFARRRHLEALMLAALNPQIVADLDALASGWLAVAGEPPPPSSSKPARTRERRRRKTPKP
jgi:hypothetical protein